MACAGKRGARLSVRRAASAGERKGSWRRGAPPSLRGSPAPPPQKRWRPERRRARARSPVGSRVPPALLPPPANTQETGQRRKSSELQIFARLGKFGQDFGHSRLVAWRLAGGACLGRKFPKQIRCGALVAACKRVESIELYLRLALCGSAPCKNHEQCFFEGKGSTVELALPVASGPFSAGASPCGSSWCSLEIWMLPAVSVPSARHRTSTSSCKGAGARE